MSYNDLRKGRVSLSGGMYHITTATKDRTPYFTSLENGRKVVRELMVLNKGKLSEVVQMLKGRSAYAIGQAVWQSNYFDHALRKDEDMRKIAR